MLNNIYVHLICSVRQSRASERRVTVLISNYTLDQHLEIKRTHPGSNVTQKGLELGR